MEGPARLKSKISNIEGLLEIIGAMRSLAAIRVQEGQNALAGVRGYAETVGEAIAQAVGIFGAPVAGWRLKTETASSVSPVV